MADKTSNIKKERDRVSSDLLHVFAPGSEWSPLYTFIDIPEPETAYRNSSARDDFWGRFGINRI